ERTESTWSPGQRPEMNTLKDYIAIRAKGGTGAPYATREDRPIAGVDVAQKGGSYSSYFDMTVHRQRHIRTYNGPNQRFVTEKGPPIGSWEHGYQGSSRQPLRKPIYPISSTNISRTFAEIQRCTGGSKGR
ncbi:unnamed protein product, partial [Polarella glacialis]